MRHEARTTLTIAGATLAATVLGAPSWAAAYSSTTSYSSLAEMPPGIRALFIGVFVVVGLTVLAAVVISVRKARSDKSAVEEALGDFREIVEAAGTQAAQGGSTVLVGGVPFVVGGAPVAPAGSTPDIFAGIRAVDPSFSEDLFKARVNEMFLTIQYAWVNRDLEPVRRFMSNDKFKSAAEMLQRELIDKGWVNHRDSMQVTQITPVSVSRQGDFDSITMDIRGLTNYYMTDERTGEIVEPQMFGDGKTMRPFHEKWTFVRKAGVVSKAETTIRNCPNCGAPVTAGNYVKCAYCGVQLNDPTLDWVVMNTERFAY